MTRHYNTSISEDAARILNSKMEYLPDEVAGPVAVIPIMPVVKTVFRGTTTATGTLNVATLPSGKDFYLTGFVLSMSKDATSDNTQVQFSVTIDGVASTILGEIINQTLTATSRDQVVMFPVPLKLDRGTNIQVFGTFTAGTMRKTAIAYGYFVETTK